MTTEPKLIKLLIIGDNGVGKTSLLFKYVENQFHTDTPVTLLVDFKIKNLEINSKPYKLHIYDTSGQEKLAQLTSSFYRGVNGIIIAYDTQNKDTFNRVSSKWMVEAKRYSPANTPIIVVGCKSDLTIKKQVSSDTLHQFSQHFKIYTIECSSLSGENVDNLFDIITRMTVNIIQHSQQKADLSIGSNRGENSIKDGKDKKKESFSLKKILRNSSSLSSSSSNSTGSNKDHHSKENGKDHHGKENGKENASNSNSFHSLTESATSNTSSSSSSSIIQNNQNNQNNNSSNNNNNTNTTNINNNNNNTINHHGMSLSGSNIPNTHKDQLTHSSTSILSQSTIEVPTSIKESSTASFIKKKFKNLKSSQQVEKTSSPKSPTPTSANSNNNIIGSIDSSQVIQSPYNAHSTPPDITENFKRRRSGILSIAIPSQTPILEPNGRLNYYHNNALSNEKRSHSSESLKSDLSNTTSTTASSSADINTLNVSGGSIPNFEKDVQITSATTTTTTTSTTTTTTGSNSLRLASQNIPTSTPSTPTITISNNSPSGDVLHNKLRVSSNSNKSNKSNKSTSNVTTVTATTTPEKNAYGYTPSEEDKQGDAKNWHKNTLEILPTIASKSSLRLSNPKTMEPQPLLNSSIFTPPPSNNNNNNISSSNNVISLSSPFLPIINNLNPDDAQKLVHNVVNPLPTSSNINIVGALEHSPNSISNNNSESGSFSKAFPNKESISISPSTSLANNLNSTPKDDLNHNSNNSSNNNNNNDDDDNGYSFDNQDSTTNINNNNNDDSDIIKTSTTTDNIMEALEKQTQSLQQSIYNNLPTSTSLQHPQQYPVHLLPSQNNYLAITRTLYSGNNNTNSPLHAPHTNRTTLVKSESQQFNQFKQAMTLSSNAIFNQPTTTSNEPTLPLDNESVIGSTMYEREPDSDEDENVVSAATLNKDINQHKSTSITLGINKLNRAKNGQAQTSSEHDAKGISKFDESDIIEEEEELEEEEEVIDPYGELNATTKVINKSATNIPVDSTTEQDEMNSDLNERFQRVVLRYREFPSLDTNLYRLQEICTDLLHISQDFIHTVKTYGRIIIEERYLKEKTIQSKSIGGHLGGDKYIVRNVLFKFSGGSHGVNDEWGGAKVGGQELKGCMATLNCPIPGLCVPLMALVDFMGFRLIAMSVLPILSSGERSTIVYGSSDMGKTVHANEKVMPIMKLLGRTMNLKSHFGGINNSVLLYSATDVEGHIGTDGRFYLIDFSRTFPPTYPDETTQGGHLFQLFRPEFLKNHPKPLCSDAFSGFLRNDPNRSTHNQEVKEASHRLLTELIPRLSVRLKWLIKESLNTSTLMTDVHIPEQFHRQGINMRWIGHMLVIIDDRDACFVLLIEAIARVLKNDLRRRLRESMKKYNQPMSAPYIDVTTKFLNMVFGVSTLPDYNSEEFWDVTVKNELASKFYILQIPSVLTQHHIQQQQQQQKPSVDINSSVNNSLKNNRNSSVLNSSINTTNNNIIYNSNSSSSNNNGSFTTFNGNGNNSGQAWKLHDILNEKLEGQRYLLVGRHLLFTRFRDMTHLKFRKKTIEKVADVNSNLWNPYQPFDTSDLKKIGVRVKHTDLVTNAEGTFFYAKAMTERSITTAIHLLHKARKRFELALISNPNNKETLQLCAQTWCKILEFSESQGKNMSNVKFTMKDRLVINTDRYFLRAIDADPKGPLILFFYANFLVRCERYEKAEDYFLRSLEADSHNYRCLTAYANFLTERGFVNESSAFLERAKLCKAILVGGL